MAAPKMMVGSGVAGGWTPKGIRLCQALYAAIIALCLIQAALMDCNTFIYDISMLRAILLMTVSTRSLWLIHLRSSVGRIYMIVGTLLSLVLAVWDTLDGAFGEMAARVGWFSAGLLVAIEVISFGAVCAYLAFSPDASEYLSNPPDSTPTDPEGHTWDLPFPKRVRTWPFWRDLIIYFILFSILGHWAEILFCRLIIAGVFMGGYDPTNAMLWDQWLFPFSAEGTALAMVVLVLHPLKRHLVTHFDGNIWKALGVSFLINLAVCTSIDFGTGMVANQHYELWDYRDLPFNFMGQVCLQNSLVYSIAATMIVWWVYPAMDYTLRRIPRNVADGIFFGLLGLYAFLAALYFIAV